MLRLALPLRALQVLMATGCSPALSFLSRCHAMAQAVAVFPPMPWLLHEESLTETQTIVPVERNEGDDANLPIGSIPLSTLDSCGSSDSARRAKTRQIHVHVHLIVLVHGWMGNPLELSYLQGALERQAEMNAVAMNLATTTESSTVNSSCHMSRILVHSAVCNHGRTSDGVAAGGRRLADEINHWVAHVRKQHATASMLVELSGLDLSIVGNSLGGLYARYALAHLHWGTKGENRDEQPQPTLGAAVFCTTATPHLGVSAPHSYLPLPRWVERFVASISSPGNNPNGNTLRDLFGVAPSLVVADLTQSHFTKPLAAFRYRMALANAYGTDFQVPCSTAAFLSRTSSRHLPCPDNEWAATSAVRKSGNRADDDHASWMALAVQTPRSVIDALTTDNLDVCSSSATNVTTDEVAQRLDALGWTKVFIDVRRNVPSIPIPSWLRLGIQDDAIVATDNSTHESLVPGGTEVTSHELWNRLGAKWAAVPTSSSSSTAGGPASSLSSYRWHVPFGHTVLVANAKNKWYAQLNAAGQPIMDVLAKVLIQRILSTESTAKEETSSTKP
jgi:Putative serine esterase (DUF676)